MTDLLKRTLLLLPLLMFAACGSGRIVERAIPQPPLGALRLLGSSRVPYHIVFNETVVGGFSGIDRSPDSTYYIISDDRSARSPARFYTLTIRYSADGEILERPTGVVTMRGRDGAGFPEGSVDPESIRYDRRSNTLWWTSEGDEERGLDPAIREMNLDGSFVRELSIPSMFKVNKDREHGPRNNGVFEGLSMSVDGSTIIVSTEDVLKQDGPPITHLQAGPIRISFFDRSSGSLVRQIAYVPERATTPPSDTVLSGNGVVEVLARDDNHLLVLERGYAPGIGNTVRLFEIDVTTAADISRIDALAGITVKSADKKLVVDFATFGPELLDNVEGITWGTTLADGRRTLVAVSDDNFNPEQATLVYVLVEEQAPAPVIDRSAGP